MIRTVQTDHRDEPLPIGYNRDLTGIRTSLALFLLLLLLILLLILSIPRRAAAQTWSSIGPAAGTAVNLSVEPRNSDILFARGWFGGGSETASRSLDGGLTWSVISPGVWLDSFVYDPADSLRMWAASSTGAAFSLDGGATWSTRNLTAPGRSLVRLAPDSTGYQPLYVLLRSASTWWIDRSDDDGDYWTLAYTPVDPNADVVRLLARPGDMDTLFAVAGNMAGYYGYSVFKCSTTDFDWTGLGSTEPGHLVTSLQGDLQFHPDSSALMWITGELLTGGSGALAPRDHGLTWTTCAGPWGSSENARIRVMEDGAVIAISLSGLYRSVDYGETWAEALPDPGEWPFSHWQQLDLDRVWLDPDDPARAWLAAQDLWLRPEGDGWSTSVSGWSGLSPIEMMTNANDNETVLVTTADALYLTRDGGISWRPVHHHNGAVGRVDGSTLVRWQDAAPGDSLAGPVEISHDDGSIWDTVTAFDAGELIDLEIHPSNSQILYAIVRIDGEGYARVFRSGNGGQTWEEKLADDEMGWAALHVVPALPERLYAMASNGIHRSDDGGLSFTHLPRPILYEYSAAPDGPGLLARTGFAVTTYSSNGGESFGQQVMLPVDDVGTPRLGIAGSIVCRTATDVLVSYDYGDEWTPLLEGSVPIESIWTTADGEVFAGLAHGGVLRGEFTLGVRESSHEPAFLPDDIVLLPPYPNPFNGTVNVGIVLKHPETLDIDVFDMLGRRMRTLARGEKFTAGEYRVTIELEPVGARGNITDNFSSGVFVLRVASESGRRVATRLVLVQ